MTTLIWFLVDWVTAVILVVVETVTARILFEV